MSQPRDRLRLTPTPMGQRILAFMTASYITDLDELAVGIVGIPGDTLRSWIYEDLDPRTLPVAPVLLLAEALNTNPEYITGISDDPRPGQVLTYDENVIVQCYRDTTNEGRERLSKIAWEMAEQHRGRASASSPFAHVRRNPPTANES